MVIVTNQADWCPHCGCIHSTTCPRIKAIEYGENGMIKRIEFHPQGHAGYGNAVPPYKPQVTTGMSENGIG